MDARKLFVSIIVFICFSAVSASVFTKAEQAVGSADVTEGVVRKIDREVGKITLKHGEIKNLAMPAMTMVFRVRDKSLLDSIQTGDKVKFKAISEGGKLVVTEIQPAAPQ